MQAIKVLVVASKDLQKEIVESGRVGRAVMSAPSPSARARIWFSCGRQWYYTTGQICHSWGYFPDTVGS